MKESFIELSSSKSVSNDSSFELLEHSGNNKADLQNINQLTKK